MRSTLSNDSKRNYEVGLLTKFIQTAIVKGSSLLATFSLRLVKQAGSCRLSSLPSYSGGSPIIHLHEVHGKCSSYERNLIPLAFQKSRLYLAKNRRSAMVSSSSSEPSESPPKRQGLHESGGRGSNGEPLKAGDLNWILDGFRMI